jgi:hypothetical protein
MNDWVGKPMYVTGSKSEGGKSDSTGETRVRTAVALLMKSLSYLVHISTLPLPTTVVSPDYFTLPRKGDSSQLS